MRRAGERATMPTPAFTHFTVDQANRALPLVRRIVEDIVHGFAEWRERVHEFEAAAALSSADAPDPRADALQREAQRLAADIDGCVRELTALGVEFKGFDLGLVDFPGDVDGQPVFLCWRLGEPAVQHWHARDAGYAARQPLDGAVADATAAS
jgi:hypothetical protein